MAEPCLVGVISFEAARVFSDVMCFSLFCLFSLREESTENCCGFLLAFLLNKHMSFFHVMHDNLFIIDLRKTRFIFVSYTQSLVVTAPCCCSSQSMSISLYFFIRWFEKRFGK